MNKVILVGRIGNMPQLKELDGGSTVLNFTLASDRVFTGVNGDSQKETTWHRCTAWAANATNIAKYVKTGHSMLIEGRLVERTYTQEHQNADSAGKPTGDKVTVTHYATEVLVERFEFLTSKAQGELITAAREAREQLDPEAATEDAELEPVDATAY